MRKALSSKSLEARARIDGSEGSGETETEVRKAMRRERTQWISSADPHGKGN